MASKPHPQSMAGLNAARAWLKQNGRVSERTLAEKFARDFDSQWRYNEDEGYWLQWVGTHWARNQTPEFRNAVGKFASDCAHAFQRLNEITHTEAVRLQSGRTMSSMERICRVLPTFLARSVLFDSDPFLLGTPGGTIDLRTGAMKPADPDDYITVLTTVTPAPQGTPCPPQWQAFMDEVMAGNRDLQRTMQQWTAPRARSSIRC